MWFCLVLLCHLSCLVQLCLVLSLNMVPSCFVLFCYVRLVLFCLACGVLPCMFFPLSCLILRACTVLSGCLVFVWPSPIMLCLSCFVGLSCHAVPVLICRVVLPCLALPCPAPPRQSLAFSRALSMTSRPVPSCCRSPTGSPSTCRADRRR